jgi:glycosyltransferase involved in cell wall biosynthesis
MHIVWIKSDYIDPPDTGGKIRTYKLLQELNSRCHVTYVSLRSGIESVSGETNWKWASRIVTFPFSEKKKSGPLFMLSVVAAMFSAKPYIVQKYVSPEIKYCQRQFLSSNVAPAKDGMILVCDFLEMTGNVDWSLPCPKVLFQHNVESVIWRRYSETTRNPIKRAYFWFEHRRMKRFERHVCNQFDLVLTVSPQDKDVLQHHLGVKVPIEVIDTGVDTDYFAPQLHSIPTPGRLLFLGSLDWMPNIDGIKWFFQEIYPVVKESYPHVSLDIVGRRPPATILALAERDKSVNVYGSVPDVRPYMSKADIFVVPLRIGSGTRLKIFEAMATRLPVVSTTVGAEGLPLEPGHHLMVADSPAEFAQVIGSLLANPGQRSAIATGGYDLVTRNYSWKNVSSRFHEVCLNLHRQSNGNVTIE